jgi:hypothetical protein
VAQALVEPAGEAVADGLNRLDQDDQHHIVLGLTLAVVSLLGFSAMVGAVGGGGLGDLGIRYGPWRRRLLSRRARRSPMV